MLANECKTRQGTVSENEIREASDLFLKYLNAKNSTHVR
jgi:hypothetical protein